MRLAGLGKLIRWSWLTITIMIAVGGVVGLPWALGAPFPDAAARYEYQDGRDAFRAPWIVRRDDAASTADSSGRLLFFGTDRLGRDLLARCIVGGGISVGIGLAAAAVAVIIGSLVGGIAGSAGGRVDAILMRSVDVLYGLPNILIVVLFAVAVDGLLDRQGTTVAGSVQQLINILTMLAAIGAVSWLTLARVVRGQVMSLRAQPFMESARAIGVGPVRQFVRHLLPNLVGPIAVYAALTVPAAILSESFLSFLGIGIREPLPSLGNLAASGLSELNTVQSRWWLLAIPCGLIALLLVGLNVAGDVLRDRFDPRSRRRHGVKMANSGKLAVSRA